MQKPFVGEGPITIDTVTQQLAVAGRVIAIGREIRVRVYTDDFLQPSQNAIWVAGRLLYSTALAGIPLQFTHHDAKALTDMLPCTGWYIIGQGDTIVLLSEGMVARAPRRRLLP